MKKLLYLLIVVTLASCGSTEETCQYSHKQEISLNYNKESVKDTDKEIVDGCFNVTKEDGKLFVKDSKSDFSLTMSTNPNSFEIVDKGKNYNWKENNGYKLGNKMSGDTAVFVYIPTDMTPDNSLKFGTVLQFYN